MNNINKNIRKKLSIKEYKMYANQLTLDKIGIKGQERIKNTKVLIVGLGGLGCTILTYLGISGINIIGLIDGDKIEYSNLNRQILYSENNLTKSKVLAAKKK